MNVVFVSESGNLLLVYGKVDNIVYFDKKLAGRLLGLPPVAMTTTVVYHTFAMPFSIQCGRPLKFVVYHRVVLGVKKLGMCGMDFSSSVRFRFGFDKNRGFGSVSVSVRF